MTTGSIPGEPGAGDGIPVASPYESSEQITPQQATAALARAPEVFSAGAVNQAIARLAVRINAELHGLNPVFVVVMHGGLPFASDLLQGFTGPCELAYLHVSRYGSATTGSDLRWIQATTVDLRERHVLLVDDVLDQGITLRALRAHATAAGALTTRAAVLVRKDVPDCVSHADYVALDAPDEYLFGRGMDYAGFWRNLPEIRRLAEPAGDSCA